MTSRGFSLMSYICESWGFPQSTVSSGALPRVSANQLVKFLLLDKIQHAACMGETSWTEGVKTSTYYTYYYNSVNVRMNLFFVSWQVYRNKITENINVRNIKSSNPADVSNFCFKKTLKLSIMLKVLLLTMNKDMWGEGDIAHRCDFLFLE